MKKQIETICGKTKKEIRKAFFNHEINNLLSEIQADEKISKKDLDQFVSFLSDLEQERKKSIKKVIRDIGIEALGIRDDLKPPSIDELRKGQTAEEKAKFSKWQADVVNAETRIKEIMRNTSISAFERKQVQREQWLDWGLEIANLVRYLDESRVYKDQLYRIKMIAIIDNNGCSRKEAEERAKITQEYADYKNATLLKDNIEEIIRICKKKGGYEY